MSFEHLVISGGGPNILQSIGILQKYADANLLDITKVKSIYATSSGAVLGAMLCLNFEWDILINYLVGRPWNVLFFINFEKIYNSYKTNGLFGKEEIIQVFKPLLKSKDIPLNINLRDLFLLCNIELHVFTIEVNNIDIVDISHIDYPDLELIDALLMTSSIPFLFNPCFSNNNCFMDGGLLINYPINPCLKKWGSESYTKNILAIKQMCALENINVNPSTNLIQYCVQIIFKLVDVGKKQNHISQDPYNNLLEISCNENFMDFTKIINALNNINYRKDILQKGHNIAIEYIDK